MFRIRSTVRWLNGPSGRLRSALHAGRNVDPSWHSGLLLHHEIDHRDQVAVVFGAAAPTSAEEDVADRLSLATSEKIAQVLGQLGDRDGQIREAGEQAVQLSDCLLLASPAAQRRFTYSRARSTSCFAVALRRNRPGGETHRHSQWRGASCLAEPASVPVVRNPRRPMPRIAGDTPPSSA